ncbi:MAG: asparagine synthetase B [Mariniblastus sp.]
MGCWERKNSLQPNFQSGISQIENGAIAFSGFQTAGSSNSTVELNEIHRSLFIERQLPKKLSGDFVVAAVSAEAELFLCRDGAGARTIYYATFKDRFYFASEPKAIWSTPEFPRKIDPNSIAKYLTFSFVPNSETMLRDVFELPAGHILHRTPDGTIVIRRFFEFEKTRQINLADGDSWADKFRETFAGTIRDRLALTNGDPHLFLSGGLDSSIVAAELKNQIEGTPRKIRTFAMHFGADYPNELEFAKSVADRIGTEHMEVLIEPKSFLPNLRKMVWHLDDPIGDPITMPNFSLAQTLAGKTDFVFNGEGGDPCFGGPKNIPMMLMHWYGGEREPLFREKAYLSSYRRAYEELDHLLTPWIDSRIDRSELTSILTPFFECKTPERLLDKLAAINIRLKGAHLILPKVERMLAASGISPLSPLFASEMVEFSFQIPSTQKLGGGIEKVILKDAYRDQLPIDVIKRPKSGMRVPVHFWFQGELKKYARHILSKRHVNRAGIFNHHRVKQLLDYNIEEGNGRYGMRLWMLLTFEIWRRIVVEGESV